MPVIYVDGLEMKATSNGGMRYAVKVDGRFASTFDASLGALLQEASAQRFAVEVDTYQKGQYTNISAVRRVAQNGAPPPPQSGGQYTPPPVPATAQTVPPAIRQMGLDGRDGHIIREVAIKAAVDFLAYSANGQSIGYEMAITVASKFEQYITSGRPAEANTLS